MDGFGVRWAEPPTELWPRTPALNGSPEGFGFQANSSSAFINQLRFAASKSVRTSFVILASFNALAGATTAFGIYWDCYMSARRKNADFSLKASFWKVVGPAEIFPFILSLSIVVQGIIFAIVQSFGLQALLILGCEPLSQINLPAFFIVPYIQFTFGLEATIQSLRLYHPFSPRNKWSIPACMAVTTLGLTGTYVLTRFVLPPNFCFASLVFYLRRWGIGCFGIVVGIAATLITGSFVTFYRLYQISGIGEQQRITASWMAWFMALGALMLSIMAPFFYVVSLDDGSNVSTLESQLSMATVVVSNLTGLMTGGLYVLLRSSRIGKIGPKGYHEFDSRRSVRRPKTKVPHSLIFTKQMEQPVPIPTQLPLPQRRASSFYSTRDVERDAGAGIAIASTSDEPQVADGFFFVPEESATTVGVATSTPAPAPSSQEPLGRKNSSYNLFPRDTKPDLKSVYILPATAYMPSSKDKQVNPFADELPPPTIRFSGGRHNRDSSLGSSANVPIGLRVSNINDMPPVQSFYQVPPPPRAQRPSRPVSNVPVPPIPDSLIIPDDETPPPEGKDKQLPPVPLSVLRKESEEDAEEQIRLSPTVYSPQKTLAKGKSKGSPTAPRAPQFTQESYPRVDEAEWI